MLKKTSKKIYNFLICEKIFPFYLNYFPGFGADFHYFGTIQLGKSKSYLLMKNVKLTKKNIYIIDGSVFKFNGNKYHLGLIMASKKNRKRNVMFRIWIYLSIKIL